MQKLFSGICRNLREAGINHVSISKSEGGVCVSHIGAFPVSSMVVLEICTSYEVGAVDLFLSDAYCEIAEKKEIIFPLVCLCEYDGLRRFSVKLNLKMLVGEKSSSMFTYYFRLSCGDRALYTSSVNNVDFTLSEEKAVPFRLLCHDDNFSSPSRFFGGVMYQIFPDRFRKGEKQLPVRENAELDPDWFGGIPQYGEYPGAYVPNNRFFGGDLYGAADALPYLQTLGVTSVYLNPIFEAYSNHRYDTGDYMKIDGMLGGDEAFSKFIEKAHSLGIAVILDGVFNHTGDDSVYFNKYKNYASVGAYNDESSVYHDWYFFKDFPDGYESWWGIDILPKLNQGNDSCRNYFVGKDGVCRKYLKLGVDGWRLDVADELPDIFLDELRSCIKSENPNALIIGEVWENAADKIAYGKLRRYLLGSQLDSVMNYPFRNAAIAFALNGDAESFCDTLTEIYASYPKTVSDCLMNILGTHDTERILTVLSGVDISGLSNRELAEFALDGDLRSVAVKRLKLASVLQYTVYGFPSVCYGDEAGIEGGHDPFCRKPFPWGKENIELLSHYRLLGELRKSSPSLCGGDFRILSHTESLAVYRREGGGEIMTVLANGSENDVTFDLSLLPEGADGRYENPLCGNAPMSGIIAIESKSAVILKNVHD